MRTAYHPLTVCPFTLDSHLQARVLQTSGLDRGDLVALSTNYFMVKKVKAYAQFYDLDPEAQWTRYETTVTALAREAGATENDLSWLARRAENVASRKPALSDLTDENALARAAEEKDPKKKANLIVNGIMGLLRQKRFAMAEQNIDLLEDLTMRNQMAQIVHTFVAQDAIETRRWDILTQRLAKIEDRIVKIYYGLEAARMLAPTKADRDLALSYLNDARKALEMLDNGNEKAAGSVAALALLWQLDPALASVVLNDAPKAINGAARYQGEKYLALLTIPPNAGRFGYQLKAPGFDDCFTQAAQRDWVGTDLVARNIQNKYLQARARLAAARVLLEVKQG